MENVDPAERALELLPNLAAYCTAAKLKRVTTPTCVSFTTVCNGLNDPLLKSKLHFFVYVSKIIEPFLKLYQTDRPMLPFLARDLKSLLKDLLEIICVSESLKNVAEVSLEGSNLLDPSQINIGHRAQQESLLIKISQGQRYQFRKDIQKCVIAIVNKIREKSPLAKIIVQNAFCLSPRTMADASEDRKGKKCGILKSAFKVVVKHLSERNVIDCDDVDTTLRGYSKFLDRLCEGDFSDFKTFSYKKEDSRVENLFFKCLSDDGDFAHLWRVIELLLLLSHGQASVERGFSTNKKCTDVNLSKESLRGRRLVTQAVKEAGSATKIVITPSLLTYASAARGKYRAILEEKKEEEKKEKEQMEREQKKRKANEALKPLQDKRHRLLVEAENLEKSSKKNLAKATLELDWKLVSTCEAESNLADKKRADARKVEKEIQALLKADDVE